MTILDRQILRIALPAIVSNVTVPLLALVDVAIVGHLGAAAYIGAIAVGGMIFNVVYWLFAFLRMGTGGMTSQSLGRRDLGEAVSILARSLGVALLAALVLIILQRPLRTAALALIQPTPQVAQYAATYFDILIWGAPAMLSLYSFTGWLIGMQNSRLPMLIAVTQNVVNIVASTAFAFLLDMNVEGVALGTLVAQYTGLLMAAVMWLAVYSRLLPRLRWRGLFAWTVMRKFLAVNRDIFLRTLCLVSVMLFFTTAGARQGDTVLAVNTLLMQAYMVFSYVMDGFAYAGEAISGKRYGAGNAKALADTVGRLFRWGGAMTAVFTLLYIIGGGTFLRLLTDDAVVVEASAEYSLWAALMPAAGMAAFVWDGVFIGCTMTRGMLRSMFVAAVVFFAVYFGLEGTMGNHALWLAFTLYLAARGFAQALIWRKGRLSAATV